MLVYFRDGEPEQVNIDHDTLWDMWKAVKRGDAEIRIRVPFGRCGYLYYDLERIDAKKTFLDFKARNNDEIPPPPDTLPSPPNSSISSPPPDDDSRY